MNGFNIVSEKTEFTTEGVRLSFTLTIRGVCGLRICLTDLDDLGLSVTEINELEELGKELEKHLKNTTKDTK